MRDIRVTGSTNVYVCHTILSSGATSSLTLAPSLVANQLALNPQDKLGACGLLPCTSNKVNAVVAQTDIVQIKSVNTTEVALEKLTVIVSPNPSSKVFALTVNSGSKFPVRLRLTDLSGRVMESHQNIPLNTPIKVGGELMAGLYIAEVVQGNDKVAVKLIKQNR